MDTVRFTLMLVRQDRRAGLADTAARYCVESCRYRIVWRSRARG